MRSIRASRAAVGEAALLLSAFRLTAAPRSSLPDLTAALDAHVQRYLADFSATDDETGERFITAPFLDLPEDEPLARLTNCGHPPPLLLRPGQELRPVVAETGPPLGVRLLSASIHAETTVPFDAGDTLLLYTDGVIEARDASGTFYPLAQRAAHWAHCPPAALVRHLCRDLFAHTGGRLGDDALIAVHRASHSHKTSPARRGPEAAC
ncbi:PP2C family protein-serine/threonine phosphatase [Streptomyces sp. NPDC058960]|uniref:PP2C family protein-serine/threonine phosphatase n=1 Tax=Streptomyces sp. NPDC058960 TaxID=3346679 RepID=UPI00369D0A25